MRKMTDDAAGVEIGALVAQHEEGLERIVEDEMLDLQYDQYGDECR